MLTRKLSPPPETETHIVRVRLHLSRRLYSASVSYAYQCTSGWCFSTIGWHHATLRLLTVCATPLGPNMQAGAWSDVRRHHPYNIQGMQIARAPRELECQKMRWFPIGAVEQVAHVGYGGRGAVS